MNLNELLPYFHPTQLVLVDDDIDFLGNLSLQLDADLAYLLFDSTEKALDYINDRTQNPRSQRRFFDLGDADAARDDAGGQRTVTLDGDALTHEMFYTGRFSQLSVVMVDYSMPQLDGIELCRRIVDPNIRKILFTGVATETEAVDAFNQGIIDRYIRKSEHKVYDQLNETIRAFQHQYVRAMFDAAGEVFEIALPPILSNPRVAALMQKLEGRYHFVEYYLTAAPSGFMLVDGDGHVHRLVLADARTFAAQASRARAAAAPSACVDALNRADLIMNPVLLQNGLPNPATVEDWRAHCQPAVAVPGDPDLYWTVFEHPASQRGADPPVASFNAHLEWIDTMGYSLM